MEEIEVPTEHLHEKIQEHAAESKDRWSFYVALSTALMAVFAAVSSLMAGDSANKALIYQVKASDQWAYYQAKSIKSEIAASAEKIIRSSGNTADNRTREKYEQEKEGIRQSAEKNEHLSEYSLEKHEILARSVTLFQVAIAIAAISIISKRKFLWVISIAIAIAGIGFLIQGIIY